VHRREWLRRGWELAAGGIASLVVMDAFALAESGTSLKAQRIKHASRAMGTHINSTAVGTDSDHLQQAIQIALKELEAVDRLMTVHRDDSDLGLINGRKGGQGAPDSRTLEVARASRRFASLTDGALDPTILPLMRHWGFMNSQELLPSSRDIEPVLHRVGYRGLRILEDRIELDPGHEIDFGGVAKGYGVDKAVERALQEGIENVMIEAGGDLYAAGRPESGRRWKVGIRDPRRHDRILATIDVENEAVATSGGYEKFKVVGGRKVPHLLDPRTGRPARGTISATIIARSTMEADALSTATFVMGVTKSMELVHSLPGVEGLWVDAEGHRWMSPGLPSRIRFS
jgi:thiamine biosynthesis lipoprotein